MRVEYFDNGDMDVACKYPPRDHGFLFSSMYEKMNSDQKLACNEVIKSVANNSKQKLFFIDGPGGTGKTFLHKCLLHHFKHVSITALTIAWTGIAAISWYYFSQGV
jgi:DNA replication protein DnaC